MSFDTPSFRALALGETLLVQIGRLPRHSDIETRVRYPHLVTRIDPSDGEVDRRESIAVEIL